MTKRTCCFPIILLLTGLSYSAIAVDSRTETIKYRKPLTSAEQRCLAQVLRAAWPYSSDIRQQLIASAMVARADLAGSGREEYIFVLNDFASCGTAGCSLFIGERGRGGVCRPIYVDSGSESAITVLRARDHGYRRLETPCEVRFDGKEYQKVREECSNAAVYR